MTAAHYKGGHHPGNGLGLHYTALPPIVASCPYSDQLLVTRKFWSPGANRPSQVSADHDGCFRRNLDGGASGPAPTDTMRGLGTEAAPKVHAAEGFATGSPVEEAVLSELHL